MQSTTRKCRHIFFARSSTDVTPFRNNGQASIVLTPQQSRGTSACILSFFRLKQHVIGENMVNYIALVQQSIAKCEKCGLPKMANILR